MTNKDFDERRQVYFLRHRAHDISKKVTKTDGFATIRADILRYSAAVYLDLYILPSGKDEEIHGAKAAVLGIAHLEVPFRPIRALPFV